MKFVTGLSAQNNMAVRQHEQSCFYDQIVWYQPLFGLQVTTGQVKWCGRNMALEHNVCVRFCKHFLFLLEQMQVTL